MWLSHSRLLGIAKFVQPADELRTHCVKAVAWGQRISCHVKDVAENVDHHSFVHAIRAIGSSGQEKMQCDLD